MHYVKNRAVLQLASDVMDAGIDSDIVTIVDESANNYLFLVHLLVTC